MCLSYSDLFNFWLEFSLPFPLFCVIRTLVLSFPHGLYLWFLLLIKELRGIDRQSEVGFLALLEHLRYCEVGSFLKNPKHPVWVMGSETHLTGEINIIL